MEHQTLSWHCAADAGSVVAVVWMLRLIECSMANVATHGCGAGLSLCGKRKYTSIFLLKFKILLMCAFAHMSFPRWVLVNSKFELQLAGKPFYRFNCVIDYKRPKVIDYNEQK